MSEKNSFYLSLMSNSSFADFPENKTSSFTVNLPKHITLNGSWEIALAESHHPQTFDNVTPNNNQLIVSMEFPLDHTSLPRGAPLVREWKFYYEIPEGSYANVNEIICSMNDEIETVAGFVGMFKVKPNGRIVFGDQDTGSAEIAKFYQKSLTIALRLGPKILKEYTGEPRVVSVELVGKLALQLGFEPGKCILQNPARSPPNLNFGIDPNMLIYCDLIEPQLFADSHAQILRTISSQDQHNKFGDTCVRNFNVRNYLPLVRNNFKTISIDIRNSTGDYVPFNFGNFYLLLHLRRVRQDLQQNSDKIF